METPATDPLEPEKPAPATGEPEPEEPEPECSHVGMIGHVTPSADGCEDCLRIGDEWVHLRLCLTCGHVGCCDASPNRHASKHAREVGHPIIRSFEPDERWVWCYDDEVLLGDLPEDWDNPG